MQQYFDAVLDRKGNAIRATTVTVRDESGAIATIYSDNGVTQQTNPIVTDDDGEYSFYAADGRYTLEFSAPGYVAKIRRDISLFDAETAVPGPGSVTVSKLADGALTADATGRAKMADGFLTDAKVAASTKLYNRVNELAHPRDVGAVGDGVADDTTAFGTFESSVSGKDIDLCGRTFLVSAEPTGNRYFNGFFKVATELYRRSKGPGRNFCWAGNFDVWQRGTSFNSFASRAGVADGWSFARSSFASGATVSQQQGSRTSNYCMRVARNSGDTSTSQLTPVFNLGQSDSRPLAGRRVTLSFRARKGADFSSASDLLTAQIKATDSSTELSMTAAGGTYASGDATLIATPFTLTTAWQTFVTSATVPATTKQVALRFTYAPTGTAGAADYFEIEEVKLETGGVASEFVAEDLAYATSKAEEQYFKTYQADVAPGALSYLGASSTRARGTEASGAVSMPVTFRRRMRTTPTITLYSPQTGAAGKMTDGTSDINATTNSTGTSGTVVWNSAATVSGSMYYVHVVAEARL